MSDKREKRNEHPVSVDVAKHLIDNFGIEIGTRILELVIPDSVKKWMKENLSGVKGEAIFGSLSVGAARLIPDTALGEIAEEAIREFISAIKNFLKGEAGEKTSFDNLPADIRQKAEAIRDTYELGCGLLSLQKKDAKKISKWLAALLAAKGAKFSREVIRLLAKMPSNELEVFSSLPEIDKTAYFEAMLFEEEKKEPLKSQEISWLDRQRKDMDDVAAMIGRASQKLQDGKEDRRQRLRTAWNRLVKGEAKIDPPAPSAEPAASAEP